MGSDGEGGGISFGDDGDILKSIMPDSLCNSVNLLNTVELYTRNGRVVWYVNYSSVEQLYFKKNTRKCKTKAKQTKQFSKYTLGRFSISSFPLSFYSSFNGQTLFTERLIHG